MKVGDLHSGMVKLEQAYRDLSRHWEETKLLWNDPMSRQFEEKHLVDLEPEVKVVLEAAARLTDVLEKAQQEVS